MADTAVAVHQAVFDALKAVFDGVGIPVVDHPVPNQAFPFVDINRHTIGQNDTFVEAGSEHFVFLTCWSEHRGHGEVMSMLEKVQEALHRAKLPLATGHFILCVVTDRRTDLDVDGVTYSGSATVRVMTEH